MKTSSTRPPGRPEVWPLDDWNAFVRVTELTWLMLAGYDPEEQPKVITAVIEAVHDAARVAGLDRGELHWLVDDILAGQFCHFYSRGDDFYWDASGFLKWARAADLAYLGPENVAWARRLNASLATDRRPNAV